MPNLDESDPRVELSLDIVVLLPLTGWDKYHTFKTS